MCLNTYDGLTQLRPKKNSLSMNTKNKVIKRPLQSTLLWFISLLFLLMLVVSFVVNLSTTKEYLEKQLLSHSQDAATSLGLSLSASIDAHDKVAASRLIDAIFDSGDYRRIVLFDLKGQAIVIRDQALVIENVPQWFIQSISLSASAQSADVISGWNQLGTIVVESQTGYAYQELWKGLRDQLLWFLLIALVGLLVVRFLLLKLLGPLKQLETQALQMSENHFEMRAPIPNTKELAGVAEAMNDMAERLGKVFQEQLSMIDNLRAESFKDSLTGMINRQGFDGRLKAELDSQQRHSFGSLVLIQFHDFAKVNEAQGRQFGDEVLKKIAEVILRELAIHKEAFSARRSGADFSIFFPKISGSDVDKVSQKLIESLNSLADVRQLLREDSFYMGIACVGYDDSAKSLLSKADMALRQAQVKGVSGWQRYANIDETEEAVGAIKEANDWRIILQDMLVKQELILQTQGVYDLSQKLIYHQVLSRITLDNTLREAREFLPMAERCELMVPLDRLVLEKVLRALSNAQNDTKYCVTISGASLIDEQFMAWFMGQMDSHPIVVKRLMFEVSEHVVAYHQDAVKKLSGMAKQYGFRLSVDHFGVSAVSFSYLQYLNIDVIKIDHSFIRDIDDNSSNQFFLRSAIQIAHGQAIQVMAVGVETEREWGMLKTLGLDGAMGYYLQRPETNEVFGHEY